MPLQAFISGCAGLALTADERAFFAEARPCGLILFARNCDAPDQISDLVDDFRNSVGEERLLVLIDQEGGRVQRLRPPHWRKLPPGRTFGRLFETDPDLAEEAARLVAHLTARELALLGINVNCVPVLDVPARGADEIIGDRAYSHDPDIVARLGRCVAEGCLDGGVLPVIKHIPGHGRAPADSHLALPTVDASPAELGDVDFRPFAALADLPVAMTAHVLLTALDAERPASVSPSIMSKVIRGRIGFDGLVMSDDLSMGALEGSVSERAQAVIAAGSDLVLHCNGDLAEMKAIAEVVPGLRGEAGRRYDAAFAQVRHDVPFDADRAEALLAEALELKH
ncbi:MAG: beta-N-acetylhexosaminidase [Hyphomicrobiales bacterium]|nr:beta-N-acetylhexosaminidase [Hyphomicrobiales bacterium]